MSSTAAPDVVDAFVVSVSRALSPSRIQTDDLARFEVDGVSPAAAARPESLEQLRQVLSNAHGAGVAIIPFGGGAHMAGANTPSRYDVALSLAGLNTTIEHEPYDLTVTVDAGVRLADLQRALGAHGQRLPLDPPGDDAMTVGGVLASNAHGPLRHAYGTARDWLIGVRVVHADGSVSKSGGRVVKNVTGYDVHKLYVGSHGTLGVIVQATFKLAPMPRAESTLAMRFDSAARAARALLSAHDAGLALHASEVLSPAATYAILGQARWSALVRVAGGPGAVERSMRDLSQLAAAAGAAREVLDAASPWEAWARTFKPGDLSLRLAVLPSHVAEAVEALDRRFAGAAARLSATVSAGVVRARLAPPPGVQPADLVAYAREVATRAGGSLMVDAAPAALKQELDVFGPARADLAIMQRLKAAFDPRHILSPGRFAGRL